MPEAENVRVDEEDATATSRGMRAGLSGPEGEVPNVARCLDPHGEEEVQAPEAVRDRIDPEHSVVNALRGIIHVSGGECKDAEAWMEENHTRCGACGRSMTWGRGLAALVDAVALHGMDEGEREGLGL